MNLIDLINSHLTSAVVDRLASNLGEDAEATQRALSGGALPALLAGLVNNFGNSENGAGRLLDLIGAGKHDGSVLGDLGAALGGGAQTDAVLNTGKSLMGTILGSRADAVTDFITGYAGLRRSSAAALLSMVVPVILGVIGKQVKTSGLNAAGLLGSLSAVKSMLGGIAPPGLGAALGVAEVGVTRASASAVAAPVEPAPMSPPASTPAAVETTAAPAEKRGSMIPWIIVPIATLLFAYGLRTCQQRSPTPPPHPAKPAAEQPAPVQAPTTAAEPTVAPPTELPSAPVAEPTQAPAAAAPTIELAGGSDSATAKLLAFVGDRADSSLPRSFVLDDLRFAIGTAQIDPASEQTIADVAKILAAFPATRIELQGHTDNRGDAERNKTLSQARADAVRNSLLALGVAADRLTALGFGAERPLESNDSESGRAKNRRTELVVVAK